MKRNRFVAFASIAACLGTGLPRGAFALETAPPAFQATDVALQPGGLLIGHVVDANGVAKPGAIVAVYYTDQEIVRTTTDANGVFAARGIRGGQYQLVTPGGQSLCRLWAADTAPPAARPNSLVVAHSDSNAPIVRGQFGYNPVGDWVEWMEAHPYLTAGTVAAAIAVPLALADDWSSGS